MQGRLYILVSFILLFTSSCRDKIVKTEIASSWDDNTPKQVAEYYDIGDSTLKATEYYESGTLKSIKYYKNGKIEGIAIGFFESQDTAMIIVYRKGVRDGIEKTWYQSGKLMSEYTFKDGNRIKGNHFFENGQPTGKLKFENGYVAFGEYYHPNGKLRSIGALVNKVKIGEWKYYYDNGKLKESGTYEHGKETGVWEYYYENGNLKAMGEYSAGNEEGIWEYNHENGNLQSSGEFIAGKKTGTWPEFDEEGHLIHNIYF